MATRLHLSFGGQTWIARVQGGEVVLDDAAAPLVVMHAEGRYRVGRIERDDRDGRGERADRADRADRVDSSDRDDQDEPDVEGAAAAAGDIVWVTIDGEMFSFAVAEHATRQRSGSRDQEAFTPPMSATVVRVNVAPGDAVRDGDVLIALEAMKMELPIRAPRDGVIRAVHCRPAELVQPGDVLVELED